MQRSGTTISRLGARVLLGLVLGSAAALAVAETLVIEDQVQVRESAVARPERGLRMGDVESRFGAPATRHPAVGTPPITRWDYAGFSVFFEHDRVIHSVVTSS